MAKESLKQRFFLVLISAVTAIGGFLFGYDTGVISGAILFIKKAYPISTMAEGMIVAAVSLGAIFGAILAGSLSDR
ncbi:MAG: MFS transporter, partial [Simkania negevensis]|nr:MFS transporter [Simkania negevensis]